MRSQTSMTSSMSCSISTTVRPASRIWRISCDERLLLGRVEAGGRLVEQQHLRLRGERPGDLEAALVAVGQVAGGLVGAARDADELEQALRLGAAEPLLADALRRAEDRAGHARRVAGVGARP